MPDQVQHVPPAGGYSTAFKIQAKISLTASKNGIILKFRSVNCLSTSRPLKQLSKVSVRCCSQEYLFGNFLQIIVKGSVADFKFIKIPCFQHILLNTFRWMRLKHGNYSLSRILFQTFKKHSHCKSLIAKTFDEITIKMKATRPIQVTKNKNCWFQLFFN